MFDLSSAVTTCIAIYPNTNDTWDILSPFPGDTLSLGEEGFVLSNSRHNNNGLLHLLPDRLIDVGKGSNKIDFITKTNLNQQSVPESPGIGGMSKLKDFKFSILKNYHDYNNMGTRDILALYGRTVIIFLTNTYAIEDIRDINKSKVFFKGEIYSVKRGEEEINVTVRGLLNVANPLVGGVVVETSDGSQQNEAIVFGDAGDIYIPVSKKKEGETHLLQWSQSDDYIITDLFVKIGTDEEPIFCKVNTPFNIVNNEIVFDPTTYSPVLVKTQISGFKNDTRLHLKAHYEIGIVFNTVLSGIPTPGDICKFHGKHILGGMPLRFNNSLIYLRMKNIEGEDVYFFTCGWEFILGHIKTKIDAGLWDKYYPAIHFPFNPPYVNERIDFVIAGEIPNPIEKEIDALPYHETSWDEKELKDFIQQRTKESVKVFQRISSEGLVIKIDDEEMLVTYTEKDAFQPMSEVALNAPENTYVWVVRGWNNTTVTVHTVDTPVVIMNESMSQEINYTLERKLQSLTTVTPSRDWYIGNFNKFLSGEEDLTAYNYAGQIGGEHDPAGYIGLDFKLPDLSGKLKNVTLVGEAECGFDPKEVFTPSTMPDDLRNCFINLALDVSEDVENYWGYRRVFGENKAAFDAHKAYMAYYDINVGSSGKYELIFSASWALQILQYDNTSTVPYFYKQLRRIVAGRTTLFNINNYDTLKKTSMFIVFNSSNIWQRKTTFKLSLPSLHVTMKTLLSDIDIYAKIIPLNIFDNPNDTFSPVGTNCKICWHPKGWDDTIGKKDIVVISDDDERKFGYVRLSPVGLFTGSTGFTSNDEGEGFLVQSAVEYNDNAKIYLDTNQKEHYKRNGGETPFTLSYNIPDGLVNVGKNIIENDNCYVWVDQANNMLKLALKQNTDIGNPVRIIQALLEGYYTNVTLDSDAFDIAIDKRVGWNARLLVESEKRLISLVDMVSKEHGLVTYENSFGEISIVALDPPSEDEVVRDITSSEIKYKKKEVDFKEKYTDLDYLITVLDVYYDFIDNKYKGYIESDSISDQTSFTVAKSYSENEIKIKLQLQTVFEQATADNCALIKMVYHRTPTRIITIKTTLSTSDIKIGQWVTCSSTKITEVSGKIYLVLGVSKQVVYPEKEPYIELILFEYDWDDLVLRIQEVPEQTINDNYDEVPDTAEDIDEIPDAT